MSGPKKISLISGCYNESENVEALFAEVCSVMEKLPQYTFEYLFIDNNSTDGTDQILRKMAAADKRVKVILNARNFGHIRSPYYGILQCQGDGVIYLASDFQDPPSLIPEFIDRWEKGSKVVLAVKNESEESPLFFLLRKAYYSVINRLADIPLIKNSTGFGLYDQQVIRILRQINDPQPYLRGLICEIGFSPSLVPFVQPRRRRGITKNNFYTLYDIAMLGFTSHSKVPLRLAMMLGFAGGFLSLMIAVGYLAYKILFWDNFAVGVAPLVIGLFFFASIQLIFTGMLGEYIGAIHTQVMQRPIVVEKERINFD